MKRSISTLFAASLLLAGLALTGCQSKPQPYSEINDKKSFNALGIVSGEQGSYGEIKPTSAVFETDAVGDRVSVSGDRTTFLWGLVTVADYSEY
jgi:hypothetical protein